MADQTFRLPDLGEGLTEAQLVAWRVQEGAHVDVNAPLCDVETAKAVVVIPSPWAGTVQKLHARPGDSVAVGAPVSPSPVGTFTIVNRVSNPTYYKTGKVVAVFPVEDESEIMIITQQAKLIRLDVAKIKKTKGRSAQGVRLQKMDEGDMVTSASLVDPSTEEETEETPAS